MPTFVSLFVADMSGDEDKLISADVIGILLIVGDI